MDAEIKAMGEVAEALEQLDPDAQKRVLKWAVDRYGVSSGGLRVQNGSGSGGAGAAPTTFENFHDLVDAAKPRTGLQRILVTAYWFQVVGGHENLDSFQINKELKNLGHPSGNITRDLESLIGRSPQLVIQTRKEGTTKQARKRYRLTREGVRAVEQMLAGQEDETI